MWQSIDMTSSPSLFSLECEEMLQQYFLSMCKFFFLLFMFSLRTQWVLMAVKSTPGHQKYPWPSQEPLAITSTPWSLQVSYGRTNYPLTVTSTRLAACPSRLPRPSQVPWPSWIPLTFTRVPCPSHEFLVLHTSLYFRFKFSILLGQSGSSLASN